MPIIADHMQILSIILKSKPDLVTAHAIIDANIIILPIKWFLLVVIDYGFKLSLFMQVN